MDLELLPGTLGVKWKYTQAGHHVHTLNLTTYLYMFFEDEGRKPIRTQEEDVKLHSKPLYSRASPSQALLLYSSIDRRITTVT